MKKKFFIGLLLFSASAVSMSTFTSCKDTNDDQFVQVDVKYKDLDKRVSALEADVKALKDAQAACKGECLEAVKALLNDKVDKTVYDAEVAKIWEELRKIIGTDGQPTQAFRDAFVSVIESYFRDTLEINLDELKNQLAQIATLVAQYNQLNEQINGAEGLLAQISNLQDAVAELQGKLGISEERAIELINEAVTNLETSINAQLTTLRDDLTGVKQRLQVLEDANLDARVTALENAINGVDGILNRLAAVENTAAQALAQANTNKDAIEALQALVGTIQDQHLADITDLQNKLTDLDTKYAGLIADLQTKDEALQSALDALGVSVDGLATDLDELKVRVATNEGKIAALETQAAQLLRDTQYLNERLSKLVTGVLVQGTFNNLFGSFSLPIGVRANMLFNYYGAADNNYTFPSYSSAVEYDNTLQLTSGDLAMLQLAGSRFNPMPVTAGQWFLEEGDGNLGKLYLTINPSNIDFTGLTLKLETSAGNGSYVELRNLKQSDKELTFGFGRGAAGFYEADAFLPAETEALAATRVSLDKSALASSVKDLIRDRKLGDFAQLMRVVYTQINNFLPAYGLRTSWTVGDDENYSVVSQYDLAAAVAKPLSYKTMYGQSVPGRRLPEISSLHEILDQILDPSKFSFEFDSVKVDINGNNVELNFKLDSISIDNNADLYVSIDGFPAFDENGNFLGLVTREIPVDPEQVEQFLQDIEDSFNANIDNWNSELDRAFREAIEDLIDDINEQVNDVVNNQIMGQISENIDRILENIKGDINDRLGQFDRLINAYNRVANRVNRFLDDPNHYLQPMMIYNGGDGDVHIVSQVRKHATVFKLAGGNAFTLYPTSYNGEIVCPAYKKFVAVTNIWDAEGNSAQGGNAALQADLVAINNQGSLCQVIPGSQRRVAVATTNMKAGYTYEFVYTGIDYHGYTSTIKSYITIAR